MSEKTAEDRIAELEDRIAKLEKDLKVSNTKSASTWRLFQDLLGVQMMPHPQAEDSFTLLIKFPKKKQGDPGAFADMWQKVQALWAQYGGSILVPDQDEIQ